MGLCEPLEEVVTPFGTIVENKRGRNKRQLRGFQKELRGLDTAI